MTPGRLRECLGLLRWSQRGLAEVLECDDRLVRRWASGDGSVPAEVSAWLETLAAFHASIPVPQDWRRRATA